MTLSIPSLLQQYQIKAPLGSVYDIDTGWLALLDNAFQRMIQAGWNRRITEIKSKFCILRIYIKESNPVIDQIIRETETLAGKLCERCGESHHLKTPRYGKAWCHRCLKIV